MNIHCTLCRLLGWNLNILIIDRLMYLIRLLGLYVTISGIRIQYSLVPVSDIKSNLGLEVATGGLTKGACIKYPSAVWIFSPGPILITKGPRRVGREGLLSSLYVAQHQARDSIGLNNSNLKRLVD